MTFRVIVQPAAEEDLRSAYAWYRQEAPHKADEWLAGMETAVLSLREFPERCGLAPEDRHFAQTIRQLLHGKTNGRYRILFTIERDAVHVLHIRHAARRGIHEPER